MERPSLFRRPVRTLNVIQHPQNLILSIPAVRCPCFRIGQTITAILVTERSPGVRVPVSESLRATESTGSILRRGAATGFGVDDVRQCGELTAGPSERSR